MSSDVTPILGYKVQDPETLSTVNLNKVLEERILRALDVHKKNSAVDKRWLNIARTHLEQGFMALNRSLMRPGRVNLPEDTENATPPQG